jgi:Ca2+-binding EF-hand superfamily protein
MIYTEVLADQMEQNYQAANIYDLDCNGSIGYGDLATMCENWLMIGEDIPGDFYKDGGDIVNFLDFVVFVNVLRD